MESRAESLEVLVLCASPVGDLATLKLAHELVQFENELRKAQIPVRLKRVFPPTIEQLRRELAAMSQRGERPGVFHFLGHGDDDGLYFEDEFGESQLVKGAELKQALAESPVKLVLLNACWSATKRGVSLVEFLQREAVTETAIGHEVPVADVSAVQFAQRFYELAMSGKSVKAACQQAANSLAEAGLPGAADVKLVGNGELRLTDGLPIGKRAFVSDDGLPTIGHLPDASV
ncbi:MAG: CHAT domain-containing protein, partial [Planctomycetaceae bacterium]|nr:CHAT domain-containing protein [Planctomycetaceae bacterium]